MDPAHLNKLFSISNWLFLIPCYCQNSIGDLWNTLVPTRISYYPYPRIPIDIPSWNDVLVQVLYGFESLLMCINVLTNFEIKFGLRGFKIGILGWKMEFSRKLSVITRHGEWIYSPGRVALWQQALFRVLASFSHIYVLNWLSM